MKALIASLALVLTSASAFAGEGVTILNCKSASGKTTVQATKTDGGEVVFQYSLRNADDKGSTSYGYINKIARMNTGDGSDAAVQKAFPGIQSAAFVVFDSNTQISYTAVTMDAQGNDEQPVELVSKPGTISLKGQRDDNMISFRAILSGRDPRVKAGYKWLQPIQLDCTARYTL